MSEERDQFVGWIADRFQERHVTPLDRAGAMKMAAATIEYVEEDDGSFGHPDFDWSEGAARSLADEEIEAGWEAA